MRSRSVTAHRNAVETCLETKGVRESIQASVSGREDRQLADLERRCVGVAANGYGDSELRLENWQRPELTWENKVKQAPEFLEPVLDGAA